MRMFHADLNGLLGEKKLPITDNFWIRLTVQNMLCPVRRLGEMENNRAKRFEKEMRTGKKSRPAYDCGAAMDQPFPVLLDSKTGDQDRLVKSGVPVLVNQLTGCRCWLRKPGKVCSAHSSRVGNLGSKRNKWGRGREREGKNLAGWTESSKVDGRGKKGIANGGAPWAMRVDLPHLSFSLSLCLCLS